MTPRKSMMLATTLLLLSACASKASGTDANVSVWCLNDRWMCASHSDTTDTQKQVVDHNIGFMHACPSAPRVCK